MERYIEVIEKQIELLNEANNQLANLNVIDKNSIVMRKIMQGKINKGYSLIVDVKMKLEKILKEVKENE